MEPLVDLALVKLTMHPCETMPLGIIIDQRKIAHPWQDQVWRLHGVLMGAPAEAHWQRLRQDDRSTLYLAKTMDIHLYPRETEGYKANLESGSPAIFVVLRANEDDGQFAVEPFLLTVCPFEAADYLDSGEEQVESTAMIPEVRAWVEGFVRKHHVERKFKKRKQRRQRAELSPRRAGVRR